MITEIISKDSPEITYKKILKRSQFGDFEIDSTVRNEQISLKGGRDCNTALMVFLMVLGLLLFIVGILIALIYYFTRPYEKIIIILEPHDTGTIITITTRNINPKVAVHEIKQLVRSD